MRRSCKSFGLSAESSNFEYFVLLGIKFHRQDLLPNEMSIGKWDIGFLITLVLGSTLSFYNFTPGLISQKPKYKTHNKA
jgi:hypothetical protein